MQVVGLCLLLAGGLSAADHWIRLRSDHFEVYTPAGERSGKQAVAHFEQGHGFFKNNMRLEFDESTPVRVILFKSDEDARTYGIREGVAAYYLPGAERDTIVMRRGAMDAFHVAVHEFVHLLVRRSPEGKKVPVWLNEGFAELFSTLTPMGNKLQVGQFIPGRMLALETDRWLDLDTLLAVDHKSPHYRDKKHAGVFYAQSWLLTHMLFLSDKYRPQFNQLHAAIIAGTPPRDAFQNVYRKDLLEVSDDLLQYRKSNLIKVAMFEGRLAKSAEAPQIEAVSAFEKELVLTTLLDGLDKQDEARKRYLALREAHPGRSEVHESLAYLEMRSGRRAEALPHFAKAASLGSTNPKLYVDYGYLLSAGQAPTAELLPVLEKAHQLNPDNLDVRLQLAGALFKDDRPLQALSALESVKQVTPDRAPDLFRMLAFAYYQAGRMEEAKKAAGRAKQYAKEARDIAWLDQFLAALDRPKRSVAAMADERPTLRRAESPFEQSTAEPELPTVEGTFTQFDCDSEQPLLHVKSGSRTVVFAIQDPGSIVIRNAAGGTVDLACGPQKPRRIIVGFLPWEDAKTKAQGVVRTIEFP